MIKFIDVSTRQDTFVLPSVNLQLAFGKHYCIMGKTGCGKTTLIELLCGLRKVTQGTIWSGATEVSAVHPSQREIGYVPQDLALFNHMTVFDNIAFSLKLRHVSKEEIVLRVNELAETLGISSLLQQYPVSLSGGEKQRVALGRAVIFKPKILCLDEPFSALDDVTKSQLFPYIKRLRAHYGLTILHISHAINEALALADAVIYFNNNQVTKYGMEAFKKEWLHFDKSLMQYIWQASDEVKK